MSLSRKKSTAESNPKTDPAQWIDLVAQKVSGVRHGTVEVVVHDARVVQIEQTENFYFDKSGVVKD